MKAIVLTFVSICLLRRGPEVVPTHPWFLASLVGANIMISLLLMLQMELLQPLPALAYISASMTASAALVWFALYLRDFESRFPATITALFGCDLLLTTLLLVLLQVLPDHGSTFAQSLVALIMIWSVAVSGYILHRALQISVLAGILLALAVLIIGAGFGELAMGG